MEFYFQSLYQFLNHPFFVIVGGITTLLMIVGFLYTVFLVIKGVLPVWYRLGLGLSKREIAIFADDEFESLKNILVDSKIFEAKNVKKINHEEIKKAKDISLLLVHWKAFGNNIDDILRIKKHSDALIVYAPQKEGQIDKEVIDKITSESNSILVNFKGRLLNDILTSMMTTSYEKR